MKDSSRIDGRFVIGDRVCWVDADHVLQFGTVAETTTEEQAVFRVRINKGNGFGTSPTTDRVALYGPQDACRGNGFVSK